jgi:hypothetical protein
MERLQIRTGKMGGSRMTAAERRACDGLLDDDAPIASHMDWLKEHCERLAWELESTSRELQNATATLREIGGRKQ